MADPQSSTSHPFPRIAIAHVEGSARSVRHRQQQFQRLHLALVRDKIALVQALQDDNGYTGAEADFEYSLALSELRTHYESVDLGKELEDEKQIVNGSDKTTRCVGVGLVYIVPNGDLYSIIAPLAAAMAAGNCAIIEVSLQSLEI